MPGFVLYGEDGSPSADKTVVPTLKHLIAQLLGDGTSDSRSKAALALQYLSLNSDNAMAILDHPDALKALRFVLMNGSQDDREYAAGAIAHLAVNEEAEHIIANTEGILPALVALLRFGTEKGKQQAAAALENLSVSNGLAVCRQDGVIEGLTQLVLNTQDSKGMETAAAVLQNLALIPECRRSLQTPPLFRGLVNILLFGSSKAKEDSAAAIGNLAASEEIVDAAMHTPSLLDGLVELLLTGSDRGKSDAATAIGNLSIRDDMRSTILDHPGLLGGLDSMLNSLSERHKGEAAFCIQNLSICSLPQKIRIAKYGRIVDGLVNLVSRQNLHSQYQEDASSALLNLLVGCSENKKSAIRIPNFMSGTIYCMRYGSDRSQENATAILQNLAFNDHEIRLCIIGYPEALKFLGELILIGSHKTQEHALAAVASIARSKQGAVAMLDVRGMLESLVMMTQSSVLSIQTFAASALQAFSQFKQTADTLIRNLVATRAFLPLLQCDIRNEQIKRIHFLSATGLSSLCAFDSRVIDIIPDNVKSVLAGAVRVSMQKPNTTSLCAPSLDLLRNLQVVCHNENARSFVAATLSQLLVSFLKEADLSHDVPGDAVVETIKLCWQLSFGNDSKALLLASGIFDALSAFQLPRYAEINEIQFWASGAMLQFQLLDLNQFSMSLHKNAHDKPAKESGGLNSSFFIVYDPADRYIVEKIVSIIESCGHPNKTQLYSHSDSQWHSMDLISFASALSESSWIFVAMSNKSELDPYCRFKMEHAVSNGNQVVPLNVESGYEPHGHFGTWPAVLECTENVLEGGRSSVLLDLLRTLKDNARLQPAATTQPIERIKSKMGTEVPETLQDTTEIALTLAFEYGEIHNMQDFCAQVRTDVAAAANLSPHKVRVLNVVAGRAATLDLSSLDVAIDLHAFTTLTLAVRGDISRSPIDIAKDLKMQVNDAASKLRCGLLTSTTLDILCHVPPADDAMPNDWQYSPPKCSSIRNSSCSPFDLESISSVTRSTSGANASTSIVLLDKAAPVCDASTQSDLRDFPCNPSPFKEASNALQSEEGILSVHNESVASLPTSDPLHVNEDMTRSRQSNLTKQMQPGFVESTLSVGNPDLSMPLSHNGQVEMIQSKPNSTETDIFGFDAGSPYSRHDCLGAPLCSDGNLTRMEAVGTRSSPGIDKNEACLNSDLEGNKEGTSAIIDKTRDGTSNKNILQHGMSSVVSGNGIKLVSDSPDNLRHSNFAQSQSVDRFYEYQPDLQLHLLVRKQDLMIESLQGKLELLQMQLQLYQDGARQIGGSSRTVLAAHTLNPHLVANLRCDTKLASTCQFKTESRGDECKILAQNVVEVTALPPGRVSMESKATECRIITPDNQNVDIFPLKQTMESKSTECNIVCNLISSDQSSSVYVQTIPMVPHQPSSESKGTECRLLMDTITANLSDTPKSALSRPPQHEKLNASVRSWAESLAGNEQKENETVLLDTLNGFVSEMLERFESTMATKLKEGIQSIENRGVMQRVDTKNNSQVENLVSLSTCKLGQSVRGIQALPRGRETDSEATDPDPSHESLKNNLLLQTFAKITSDMLVRFESTLDSRLKECVEKLRGQTANNHANVMCGDCPSEISAGSVPGQVSHARGWYTKVSAIKPLEHTKDPICPVRSAPECHELQNECLYGLYQSLESCTSHFTDTVSLSPTRQSTPVHPSGSTQAQPAAIIRSIAHLPNKSRIISADVSHITDVGKIIAQYLPEYQEGPEIVEPPANLEQSTAQRVHRPRFQRKSPTLALSLIGPGNVCSDPSSPSQPPSTPRGISFRQLARPKAKRAIISTLHSVDLDVLASQSKTSLAESDSWLLGSSCSSVNSLDTHTSASTLSHWASSPATYKRSLTKDSIRLVAECAPVELGACSTGQHVPISDSLGLL